MSISPETLLWLGPGVIAAGVLVWLLGRTFEFAKLSLLGNEVVFREPIRWQGRKYLGGLGLIISIAGLVVAGLGVIKKVFPPRADKQVTIPVTPPVIPKPVIAPSGEAPDIRERFASTVKLFNEAKDYDEARKRLLDLYDQARLDETRDVIEGLVTATYYGTAKHREGLTYLCEQYKDRPRDDVRHRFRIHAHLRQIALKESFPAAEKLVSQLRSKYKRADLSHVWPCIPLAKMEYLREGYTTYEEFYALSPDDRVCLRRVIERYKDDPFLDHAFYFLNDPDRVLESYPNSLIMDVAYRAAGQKALKAGDYNKAVDLLSKALAVKHNPNRQDEMVSALAAAYKGAGDTESLIKLRLKYSFKDERPLLESLGQQGPFKNPTQLTAMLKALEQYEGAGAMNNWLSRNCSAYFSVAKPALYQGYYARAFREYEEMIAVFHKFNLGVPPCLAHAKEVLGDLVNGFDGEPPEKLLNLGLRLRDNADSTDRYESEEGNEEQNDLGNKAFYSAAVGAWRACAKRCIQAEAEKALYLAGRLERYQGNYRQAADLFNELATKHPASPLADDALAELGWYYLNVRSDHSSARKIFTKVRVKYPLGNAADNALNWLGQSFFMTGEYEECRDIYLEIRSKYKLGHGFGRIARDVQHNLDLLRPVIASMSKRKEVTGLEVETQDDPNGGVYVSFVEENSNAERAGILEGDIIRAVEEKLVSSEDEFYGVLASLRGSWVSLRVTREEGSNLKLRARVRTGKYYEVRPQGYLRPEF